nr:MAG TPA: hypothetical protein [Caudoviricetes sp.]
MSRNCNSDRCSVMLHCIVFIPQINSTLIEIQLFPEIFNPS